MEFQFRYCGIGTTSGTYCKKRSAQYDDVTRQGIAKVDAAPKEQKQPRTMTTCGHETRCLPSSRTDFPAADKVTTADGARNVTVGAANQKQLSIQ